MRVAVVIVNFNAGDYLRKCISALKEQVFSPARVLVVDNYSQDHSLEGIEECFPGLEILRQEQNLGFAAANNLGVKQAEDCEWIAFLNPDAFPRPEWLSSLVRTAKENPGDTFFGCHMTGHGAENIMDGTGDIYHVSGLAWRRDHGLPVSSISRDSGEIFSPCAAAALFRRDVFLEADGFDEHYFCYFEDVDLAFRLRLKGHRGRYVPDAVVEHVGSATTHPQSDFSVYHGHRNLVWTYFKNMPSQLVWIYLPQHLLANFAALFWYSLRGQAGVIFKSKWDALKGLSRALDRRKDIQKAVCVPARSLRRVMAKGLFLPYSKNKRRV
ncbi:MAG: glycosyltransferase family 2 protein [Nitrospinota bacterium]|nr:glycosyltransferase family 2 protein [Nitrospinota bacterium]